MSGLVSLLPRTCYTGTEQPKVNPSYFSGDGDDGKNHAAGMGAAMAMLALFVVGSAAREDGIASFRRYIMFIMSFSISRHNYNVIHYYLQETLDIVRGGQLQRVLSLLILQRRVSPVGEQQSAQLGPPLLRGLVQGGEAPLVRRIHHGAEPDEEGGDVQVAVGGRVVQRDEAALVLCVDVGAVLKEVLSHFEIVVAGGQVQRSGVATLRREVDNSYVYTRKYDVYSIRHLSLSK